MKIYSARVAQMYRRQGMEETCRKMSMSQAQVLHSVAEYLQSLRSPYPQCDRCSFRTKGRPCCMPIAICNMERSRRKNNV